MNSLQKFLPPGQTPGVVHTDSFLEFTYACKDLCGNHEKSTQHRSKTNGNAENAVRGVEDGTSAPLFSQSFRKCLGEKRWNASVLCETYKTNWQTENHRMKEDLTFRLMVQLCQWELHFLNIYERQKSSPSIWDKDASRNIHRVRFEFWRRSDQRLEHRGLVRH